MSHGPGPGIPPVYEGGSSAGDRAAQWTSSFVRMDAIARKERVAASLEAATSSARAQAALDRPLLDRFRSRRS